MRLIDADSLIDLVTDSTILGDGFKTAFCALVNGEPTVKVQKTGKWIDCDSSEHWKCSECGCRASYWFNEENSSSYDLDMSEWLSDYCPNCGARMVGEEE